MTEQTVDEKVERLAKAMCEAYHKPFADEKKRWAATARALLSEIGCEDGVVPDVRVAVAALNDIGVLNHPPREQARQTALRALTGGSDG